MNLDEAAFPQNISCLIVSRTLKRRTKEKKFNPHLFVGSCYCMDFIQVAEQEQQTISPQITTQFKNS